jgi:hypothetical protein
MSQINEAANMSINDQNAEVCDATGAEGATVARYK